MQKAFHKGEKMRDVIGAAIIEQESLDCGCGGVVESRDVVFQAMEDRERGEKNWQAPKRIVVVD